MARIGYARVSAPHQHLDRQIAALRAERCTKIFREKASAKDIKQRPQLEKAVDQLGKGDVLVLAEWDRATRSMLDGIAIVERVHARGALIKVLDRSYLDLTTPIGRGFIAFLSAMAEDERQRIVGRANEGRAAARRRGARFGRKPKLSEHQRRRDAADWWLVTVHVPLDATSACITRQSPGSGDLAHATPTHDGSARHSRSR